MSLLRKSRSCVLTDLYVVLAFYKNKQKNMEVKGNVVILKNFEHVTNYYESSDRRGNTLEEIKDKLRANIDAVMPMMVGNSRYWFCICKVIMKLNMVGENDFKGAANLIEQAYPEGLPMNIDVKDIQKLNSLSLSKDVTEWDEKDSPVGKSTPAYKTLALQFLQRF